MTPGTRGLFAGVGIFALAVTSVLYFVTHGRYGVSADGIVYLDGAMSLADGLGFTTRAYGPGIADVVHFPPGYSATLALIGSVLGVGMHRAAGLLGLITAAGLIGSAAWITLRWSRSAVASAIAAGVFGLHPVLLDLNAMPRSEPLYLLALMWSLHFLARFLTDDRTPWLFLTALILAAAALTRFVALAAIGMLPLAVLWLGRARLPARLAAAAAAFLVAIAPLALWLVHLRDAGAPRQIAWHPEPLLGEADQLLVWTLAWPAPLLAQLRPGLMLTLHKGLAPILIATGVTAWMVLIRAGWRAGGREPEPSRIAALLWLGHGLCYGAFVILSLVLADAATPLNDRILAPTMVSLTLAAAIGFPALLRGNSARAARVLRGAAAASVTLIAGGGAWWVAGHLKHGGPGWRVGVWGRAPVLTEVSRLPAEARIYSTRPDVVYAATGRQAEQLPFAYDPYSRRTVRLESELDSLRRQMCCGSVVVIFRGRPQGPYDPGLPRRAHDPPDSVVLRLMRLRLTRADSFARLYVAEPDTTSARLGPDPRR